MSISNYPINSNTSSRMLPFGVFFPERDRDAEEVLAGALQNPRSISVFFTLWKIFNLRQVKSLKECHWIRNCMTCQHLDHGNLNYKTSFQTWCVAGFCMTVRAVFSWLIHARCQRPEPTRGFTQPRKENEDLATPQNPGSNLVRWFKQWTFHVIAHQLETQNSSGAVTLNDEHILPSIFPALCAKKTLMSMRGWLQLFFRGRCWNGKENWPESLQLLEPDWLWCLRPKEEVDVQIEHAKATAYFLLISSYNSVGHSVSQFKGGFSAFH